MDDNDENTDSSLNNESEGTLLPAAEDVTTTYDEHKARRHLRGWLSYAFASEVFVVVSLTMFLPICLEQFARDNGVLLPDKTIPCSSVGTSPPIQAVNSTAGVDAVSPEELRCVVKIGWAWIDTASFSLYVYSISVALQALTVISMGGIANYPPNRKAALLLFASLGSTCALLFLVLPSSSPLWPLSALLAILANVGFGASVVAMNAYLPTLAREDKDVVRKMQELVEAYDAQRFESSTTTNEQANNEEDSLEGSTQSVSEPLLRTPPSQIAGFSLSSLPPTLKPLLDEYIALLSRTTSRISSTGIALGYFSGIAALIVALIPVIGLKGSTFSLRLAIGLSGAWWALFTLPAWRWLPGASGDGEEVQRKSVYVKKSLGREVAKAWRELGRSLRWGEMKKLKNTFLFLAAWFLLSDGFTTITSTALLFGKTTLHMPASSLILVGILTNASGILGSLAWPRIQHRFRWSNKKVLIILVIMCSLIPAYGCLGFLPIFRDGLEGETLASSTKLRVGGLTTPGEMFGLAVYFGTVYGAFQGYARAFYASLIPPGEEARWYGLYSITDKSSSFLGPLLVGLISDLTGNIRFSFFFLVAMVWSAVPILLAVDPEQGHEEARRYRVHREHVVDESS